METTIHCQHLSIHSIQSFQFFLCPILPVPYLISIDTAQVLNRHSLILHLMWISKLVSAFFFTLLQFFLFPFRLFGVRLNNPQLFIPFSPISPIIGPCKKVILSNLTFFFVFITKALHFFNPNYIPISSLSHSTVCTNESTWSSLFQNNFKASIQRRWC